MWFQFPKGTSGVSVQQQEFRPEVTDAEGVDYFRAPDHFAALILGLKGFAQKEPPEGLDAPADLPKSDVLRDGAISTLARDLQSARTAIGALRADLNAAQNEVERLSRINAKQEEQIAALKEVLEEHEIDLEDEAISKKLVPPVGAAKVSAMAQQPGKK